MVKRGLERLPRFPSAHERDRVRLDLWAGCLFLWPARGLFFGYAADTAPHAHHAVQICLAKHGKFGLRTRSGAAWQRFRAAIIGPDQPHQLEGGENELALLYLDPESDEGRRLRALTAGNAFRRLPSSLIAHLGPWGGTPVDIDEAATVVDRLLAVLAPIERQRLSLDARIARSLDWLRSVPSRPRAASEVAGRVSLSAGRFAHLFRDNTGVPLRRYLLWLRLVAAVQQMAAGGTLTEAASAAGFSDSAHLTRTFRRMFGIAPSALVHGTKLVPRPSGRA